MARFQFATIRKAILISIISIGVLIVVYEYGIGLAMTHIARPSAQVRQAGFSTPSMRSGVVEVQPSGVYGNATDIPHAAVCQPVTKIVFIKTHKTGSTSLHCLLVRFGYHHELSFVLNRNNTSNGHFRGFLLLPEHVTNSLHPPIGVKKGDYANYKFDLFANHVVYAREAMDSFMSGKATYISILREPGVQIESHINFFGYFGAWNDIERYAKNSRRFEYGGKTYCRNNQLRFFGPVLAETASESFVKQKILELDEEFDLILIAEYFDESLILLKKLLCWEFDDILYIRKNTRVKPKPVDDKLREKIYNWSRADVLLYQHFNNTLWQKIDSYGPSFWTDLEYFRRKNEEVTSECVATQPIVKKNQAAMVQEFGARSNVGQLCRDLVRPVMDWYSLITARQRR